MTTKFIPLHDRILVRRKNPDAKSRGGIWIPDAAKEKPQEGEVLAIGPGVLLDNGTRRPMNVAVGDVVVFYKSNGTLVKIDGEELLVIGNSDCLAVVEPD